MNATKEQQQIITTTEGYIRCGAVPGSGKTFSITARIAYLITELYVDPSSIVALTFTNKAAASMTNRLKKMIGEEATCFTGTFHGFCNKILKEEIHRLSYPKTFTILDKSDQINLIREVAEELNLSLREVTAKDYMEEIGKRKRYPDYIRYMKGSSKQFLLEALDGAEEDVERVFYHYLLKQRDNYTLDFEDIINYAIYILQHNKEARATWQDKCQYILCDEYQDVNDKQELLLKLLSGKYENLTVVGDDDQCIYGWRGSKVDYMVDFDKAYPGVQDFYLSENFRSTPEIVALANSLIGANQHRLAKKMFTNNPSGTKPVYNQLKTEGEEALWIADTINAAVKQGAKYADHTVLVRASSQTRALEEMFLRRKVPYKILNGAQFYGSEEIKTVLAYLRMIYTGNDMDFLWTIQRPRRGFGKRKSEELKAYAGQHQISLLDALGEQIGQGMIKKREIIEYYHNITNLQKSYEQDSCKELVNRVLDFGYRRELQNDVDQTKIDNVAEFLNTVADLEEENQENLSLEELLTHFALFSAQDDDTAKDVVRIMTVHTAKGLEFDTVFVNGLVEGQFPSGRLKNPDEMEEERRLLYVAVTRAQKHLYLSSYEHKNGSFVAAQSRFLSNIDAQLVECIGRSRIAPAYEQAPLCPKASFQVGETVLHKVFGEGRIVSVDESGQTYEIAFENMPQTRRIQFRAKLIRF